MIVVYEYMSNGSLRDQLLSKGNTHPTNYSQLVVPLSWKKRLEISIGVARGLHYLHAGMKRTIFHRDIKTNNIVLDENWVPKLTDFGYSLKGPKFSSKVSKPIQTKYVVGAWGYLDPEYLSSCVITDKSDVYSFGVVLLELVCGSVIFSENLFMGIEEIRDKVIETFVERGNNNGMSFIDQSLVGEITPQCFELYMDIVDRCLNKEGNERPTMGEVEVELELVLDLQEQSKCKPISET